MLDKILDTLNALGIELSTSIPLQDAIEGVSAGLEALGAGMKVEESAIYAVLIMAYERKILENHSDEIEKADGAKNKIREVLKALAQRIG